jgi:hypothetical protein
MTHLFDPLEHHAPVENGFLFMLAFLWFWLPLRRNTYSSCFLGSESFTFGLDLESGVVWRHCIDIVKLSRRQVKAVLKGLNWWLNYWVAISLWLIDLISRRLSTGIIPDLIITVAISV